MRVCFFGTTNEFKTQLVVSVVEPTFAWWELGLVSTAGREAERAPAFPLKLGTDNRKPLETPELVFISSFSRDVWGW